MSPGREIDLINKIWALCGVTASHRDLNKVPMLKELHRRLSTRHALLSIQARTGWIPF